jgi:hypothetical protein
MSDLTACYHWQEAHVEMGIFADEVYRKDFGEALKS